ncbi:hypothetical protein UFOVP422_37 [uncultured Caudovirales phage]|uniref:Uncharacterized protein n=1 Tax=uncultured Caudovirales phage TaxID=2100421 RepID=A0A6J5MA06_9CAUD|nr:hypothetical protein UFOVP422_37 [uncultured Caudovirales phage]
MNANKWVTDRMPNLFKEGLYVFNRDGFVVRIEDIREGEPWRPIERPEPYKHNRMYKAASCGASWGVYRITKVANHTIQAVHAHSINTLEAAERIAAIYEEGKE